VTTGQKGLLVANTLELPVRCFMVTEMLQSTHKKNRALTTFIKGLHREVPDNHVSAWSYDLCYVI